MNHLDMQPPQQACGLRSFAIFAIANCLGKDALLSSDRSESAFLLAVWNATEVTSEQFANQLNYYIQKPNPIDIPLIQLADALQLTRFELLSVSLAAAVEDDAMVGRAISFAMSPIKTSRPTIGLLTMAFSRCLPSVQQNDLLFGNARRTGLITIMEDDFPTPEQIVRVPSHLCAAIQGSDGDLDGVEKNSAQDPIELPISIANQVCRHAEALAHSKTKTFVVRSGSPHESHSVAELIARTLELRPLFIRTDDLHGFGPWLQMRRFLPIHCCQISPGEKKTVPQIGGYTGPQIVLTGVDGTVDSPSGPVVNWRIPAPTAEERRQLWQKTICDDDVATRLAKQNRHRCGRIAELGSLARYYSRMNGSQSPNADDIYRASCSSSASGLDALAQFIDGQIDDDALIISSGMRKELDQLVQRCMARDGLADELGISAAARYQPGVRALLVGPSGTGKTMAASWIATQLRLPLYRVDLASVTSKYIGETEKNLSQLFGCAEECEVVLLFDEADSLFGKRTEVHQANDRHANAQTNYLLQRMESFDGIVILTSNSRSRFDPAFSRRLDMILEFPHHGPEQRRKLWRSHLGNAHQVTPAEINRLAATADLSGGHIRNIVLSAAAVAKYKNVQIGYTEIVESMSGEYRKLGQQMPMELRTLGTRVNGRVLS